MLFDPASLAEEAVHDLLKACVAPRPIAWVSTAGPGGLPNAAPFSCFTFLAPRPPLVGLSIAPRGAGKKDTIANIEREGDFVINAATEPLVEKMNATSADLPPEESEFTACGLTPAPSERVKAPRIAESPLHLECRLVEILPVGPSGHRLVVGEVVLVHAEDRICRDGRIAHDLLRPIGRMAGEAYVRTRDLFEIPRPWLAGGKPG